MDARSVRPRPPDDPRLAFFYGGLVRMKSVLNIMMMSFGAMGVVAVVWALWGYGWRSGPMRWTAFVGDPFANFGLSGLTSSIGAQGGRPAGHDLHRLPGHLRHHHRRR